MKWARRAADAGIDVAELNLRKAELETMFQTYRAYAGLQWYREIDNLLSEAETRLDQAVEQLEIQLDDGDRGARTALRQITIARTRIYLVTF